MRNIVSGAAATLSLMIAATAASAGLCDYRPSNLIGTGGAAAVAAGSGAVAGARAAATAAGLYTFTHAGSGAVMLGSTAGGASAAGTVGIMGGTAGAGAAVMSVVLNPLVWVPAAVTAVGLGAFEGGCYLAD
ncbi:MAG: hypothetical protein N2Z62_10250 [Rhodobacteraceae bacterium]|nr:hypothetical protein [Paracoccaceae bacterium]